MYSYFVGTGTGNPTATLVRYYPLDGVLPAAVATENQISQVIPDDITVTNWYVKLANAPGASKTLTLTIVKNGTDTAKVLTITGSGTTTGSDTSSLSFSKGDRVSVKVELTSGGTNPSGITWTLLQSGSGQCVLFGGSATQITASTFFGPVGNSQSTTENQGACPLPYAGTIKNLYVTSDAAMTGTQSWTVTVRASGDTTLTCVLDVSNPTANHDTTHTPSVSAGNRMSVHVVAANSPAASRIAGGFVIVPTTAGDACFLGANQNNPLNTATRYQLIHGNASAAQATADGVVAAPQAYLRACTIKAIYVQLGTSTGAAKSWTCTVRLNNTTDTAAAATVLNASTGNTTGVSVAVADGDLVDIKITNSGTPNAGVVQTGVHYTISGEILIVPAAVAAAAVVSVTRVARTRTLWNTIG